MFKLKVIKVEYSTLYEARSKLNKQIDLGS
jgi:hypothetical protein